jgi:hypothetical protein
LICVALDLGAKLIWFRRTASGNWNGNVANDPGTGVGGVNIAAITATTLPAFALVAMATGTAGNVTANFGGSAFSGSPSSGYANGIGVGATFPNAWNLNDKTSNVTLSGGNVIGTATGSPQGGARGLYSQTTGKYYWECVCNTITGIGTAVGATISGYAFTIAPNSAGVPGMVALTQAGNIRTSGGNAPGVAFGTITSGTLVGIAYDIGAALIWFRLGAAGNWNANVANNPTTGVGGVSTTGMGAGVAAFPTMWTQATSDQITGNFGAAAFTGTAPAGFTGGFSGDLPVSGARVQAMVMA